MTLFRTGWLLRVGRLASRTLLLKVVDRLGLGSSGNVARAVRLPFVRPL